MSAHPHRLAASLATSLLVLALAGADDAPRAIQAGELNFAVPSTWKVEQPSSPMRKAQLSVDAVEGDAEPAGLVLFMFPNGAGTVEANIKRWESGFVDADGKTPKAKVDARKGKNVDVTRVEVGGRYVAAAMPGQPGKNNKPGFRLLGAIVETPTAGYFYRLVGPEKTIAAAAPGFDAMIASIKKTDD